MNDAQRVIHLATVKAMRLYITRAVKTQEAYLRHMWQDAREYFTGEQDAFEFIDSMVAEIDNQLTRAWNEGARDAGVDPRDMDDPDLVILQDKIENEREYILGLAGDIDQARADGLTPAEFKQRFYSRVEMWANRYKETVNEAKLYFGSLDKYEWQLGATEQHCTTCLRLNGVVATGEEWDESGYRPQSPPNDKLECGGWKCDCSLVPTKRRRTRGGIPDVSTKSMKYSDDQPRDEAGRWTDGASAFIDSSGGGDAETLGWGYHLQHPEISYDDAVTIMEKELASREGEIKPKPITPNEVSQTITDPSGNNVTGEAEYIFMNPNRIEPVNKISDKEKYNRIVSSMRQNGWNGDPILAYDAGDRVQAITGSHRIYAAREAGIEIPVSMVDIAGLDEVAGEDFANARDDEDLLSAFELAESGGAIPSEQVDIMRREVRNNR